MIINPLGDMFSRKTKLQLSKDIAERKEEKNRKKAQQTFQKLRSKRKKKK